jgi:hypothetical protein
MIMSPSRTRRMASAALQRLLDMVVSDGFVGVRTDCMTVLTLS